MLEVVESNPVQKGVLGPIVIFLGNTTQRLYVQRPGQAKAVLDRPRWWCYGPSSGLQHGEMCLLVYYATLCEEPSSEVINEE